MDQFPSSSSNERERAERGEREAMFEKVVTPSDVGKLNRLVIPKQHAERYFPLDPTSNEKGGLLLNFEEDRTGKPWRFRYSYWNSSQSYVMTKGWSRFVKDKSLDAGDTVSFSRGAAGQLFIDWRRRPQLPPDPLLRSSSLVPTWGSWGGSVPATLFHNHQFTYPAPAAAAASGFYFRSAVGPTMQGILESVPVGIPRPTVLAEPRGVRIFGVNLAEPPPSPLQWQLLTAGPTGSAGRRSHELSLLPPPPPPQSDTEDSRSNEETRRVVAIDRVAFVLFDVC